MTFFESRSIFLFEHDLFGKPLHTFPNHALELACRKPGQRVSDTLAIGRIRLGAVGDMPLLDMLGGLPHLACGVVEKRLLLRGVFRNKSPGCCQWSSSTR